jgi:integrase
VADWFNGTLLVNLGIKRKDLTLYSLRHTFRDAMRRHNSESLTGEIMGHGQSHTTTDAVYGTQAALALKKEAIERLWFETFDFRAFLETDEL